jgi:hypothetical protein
MTAAAFVMPILSVNVRTTPDLPQSFEWVPTGRDRARALRNHSQTLEVLRSRGGLAWMELAAVLEDRSVRFEQPRDAHRICVSAVALRSSDSSE